MTPIIILVPCANKPGIIKDFLPCLNKLSLNIRSTNQKTRIGLLSDTHGYLDDAVFKHV